MNTNHASAFTVLGTLMHLLPVVMPGLDGSGTRELWLQFMGAVNFTIGAGWLGREVWHHLTAVRLRLTLRERGVGVPSHMRSAA